MRSCPNLIKVLALSWEHWLSTYNVKIEHLRFWYSKDTIYRSELLASITSSLHQLWSTEI